MAVPTNKEALLKEMDKSFTLLMKKLELVPLNKAFKKELEGHSKGTKMSVANLISYLIGWGELVLHWHVQEAQGKEIIFPAEGHKWNELGKLAQKFYKNYEHIQSLDQLVDLLEENHLCLMFLVESFSKEELYKMSWYGKWTRGRMIQFNTASPYKNAVGRLNGWL